jgi:23S rRNA (uracil1939-C5)-methyltransferase
MKVELYIEDLGDQGDGIARHDGQTLFVEGALKGEKVRAEVSGNRARILEMLEASCDRVDPRCPHRDVCGGCRLQQMKDEAYRTWKTERLIELLKKGGIETDFLPSVFAEPKTRRRARFAARRQKGKILIGFNKRQSHEIIGLSDCAVLHPVLTKLLPVLSENLGAWLAKERDEGDIQLTLLEDGIDLVLIGGGLSLDLRQDLAALAEAQDLAQVSWRKWDRSPIEPVSHRRPLSVRHGGVSVPFPPASFLQATVATEKALIDFAKDAVGSSEKVADLFGGLGGFGLSMEGAKKATIADLDGPAIQAFSRAVKGLPKYNAVCRDLLREPFDAEELSEYDAVIFDPPRGGAKKQAEQLSASKVQVVVGISCDPASFVRDAKILADGGYRLETLLPVDQFLWSVHMELASIWRRS